MYVDSSHLHGKWMEFAAPGFRLAHTWGVDQQVEDLPHHYPLACLCLSNKNKIPSKGTQGLNQHVWKCSFTPATSLLPLYTIVTPCPCCMENAELQI